MKWRWLGPLLAAVFLYSLVTATPAALMVSWLLPTGSPLSIDGVSGSLSKGEAAALSLRGRPSLQRLHWQLRPVWLLLGRFDWTIGGGDSALHFAGELQWGLGGMRARHLTAGGRLKDLLPLAGLPFVPADGVATLKLDRLRLAGSRIVGLRGQAQIQHLNWTLTQQPLELGTFNADLSTADGTLSARLSTLAGPIDVGGTASLNSDRRYELNLTLKPKPGASSQLTGILGAFGRPDLHDVYHYRQSGTLPTRL
ncbi:MAG: type II secretion system protein N [Gammaproteobacteria bacterium]|nr:type II secretion system protein N [Gammaproteobacteria bacterium]